MTANPTTQRLADGSLAWAGEQHERRAKPFPPANTASLVYGGYSDRTVTERAELVRADLYAVAPHLEAQPAWALAVERFLTVEARSRIFAEHIERIVTENGAGAVPTRTAEVANATARLANDLGAQLGLDPLSFAKIRALGSAVTRNEAGAGLADLIEQGQQIIARRQAQIDAEASAEADTDTDTTGTSR